MNHGDEGWPQSVSKWKRNVFLNTKCMGGTVEDNHRLKILLVNSKKAKNKSLTNKVAL